MYSCVGGHPHDGNVEGNSLNDIDFSCCATVNLKWTIIYSRILVQTKFSITQIVIVYRILFCYQVFSYYNNLASNCETPTKNPFETYIRINCIKE